MLSQMCRKFVIAGYSGRIPLKFKLVIPHLLDRSPFSMTPAPDAPKKTKVVGKDGLTKHQRYYKRWCTVTLQLEVPITKAS
jgi:hypothetical protein